MTGALEGHLVVALEQAVAAPLCSAQLARAGARVVKIERPEGDFARQYDDVVHGESAYFLWLNSGKESICLDLKAEDDRALLTRMLQRADVFIQNLAPGAAARHGFGSDALRHSNPRLITVDISGYGETGPYAEMKAYDLLIQGESGLASITGSAAEPGRVGVSICDIACGMYAHAAVLEALIERQKTGRGTALKISLFDAIANWMTVPLLHHDYGGSAPCRVGLRHPSIAPYGVYKCIDNGQILIAIQNDREWRRFCGTVLELPELADQERFATNSSRVRNRDALDGIITAAWAAQSKATLIARLRSAQIAFGAVNEVAELSTHPQLRRMTVSSPSGDASLVCDPVIRSGEWPAPGPVPRLGEHGAQIRQEFG